MFIFKKPVKFEHVSTFDAISYISNGKPNKKFLGFSENLKWIMIAEYKRFGYLYKKKEKKEVKGVHQIVDLVKLGVNEEEEILGLQMVTGKIVLLTRQNVVVVEINDS